MIGTCDLEFLITKDFSENLTVELLFNPADKLCVYLFNIFLHYVAFNKNISTFASRF